MRRRELARIIDYALVKPTQTVDDVKAACREVLDYGIGVLCVLPPFVELASRMLGGTGSRVCGVVSFPFGSSPTAVKVREAEWVIDRGAEEVDFVMNIPLFKSGLYAEVLEDMREVTLAVKSRGATAKIIIETGYLTQEEVRKASVLVEEAGADYVKTCTGFGPRGATLQDVELIKSSVRRTGVKAAGGISSYSKAMEFVRAGATRIGTSRAVDILREAPE